MKFFKSPLFVLPAIGLLIITLLHAADVRIKDIGTTATVPSSDDYYAIDGVTSGTRKIKPINSITGTSGGIIFFNATNTMATSGALAAGNIVVGGGAGATPATVAVTYNVTNSTLTVGANGAGNITGNVITANNISVTTLNATNITLTEAVPAASGGTGVANTKNITVAGNFTTAGTSNLTLTTSATTNATIPPGTVSLGFRNIPQNGQTANYTTVAEDVGKMVIHTSAASGNHTFTVNNTASADGDAISFLNAKTSTTVTLTLSSGNFTLYQGNLTATGANASVPAGSIATIYRIATGDWAITGSGVTVP